MGVRLGSISCEGPRDGRAQLPSPAPSHSPLEQRQDHRGSVLTTVSQVSSQDSRDVLRPFVRTVWWWKVELRQTDCCPLSGGKREEKNFAFGERHIP